MILHPSLQSVFKILKTTAQTGKLWHFQGNSTQTELQQEIPKSQYLTQKSLCMFQGKRWWADLWEAVE